MNAEDVVRIAPPYDRDGTEGWTRAEHEPDIGGVDVFRYDIDGGSWQVVVQVMEFVRQDPLEGRLREAILAALRAIPGVIEAEGEDRESWVVSGEPAPQELVRAVARVVDSFADEARAQVKALPVSGPGPTTNDPRALRSPFARRAQSAIYKLIAFLLVSNAATLFYTHPHPNPSQWIFRTGMISSGIGLYVVVVMRDRRIR